MPTTEIKIGDIVRVCRENATDGIAKDSIGVVVSFKPNPYYDIGVDWIIVAMREGFPCGYMATSLKRNSNHKDADFYLRYADVEVIDHA